MTTPPSPPWPTVCGDPLGPTAATRRGTWLFVLFVVAVALYDLGGRSLHNLDLPRFGVLAREMIRTGEWLVPTRYGEIYANKPPLYIWLIALPAQLSGGVTPFLVRLPCALGLVAMVLSTSAWGRLRSGSLGVGRAAALLLLGTFLLTRLGRESRPDMLAAGLAAWGTYLLDRLAVEARGRRHAMAAGLVLGLAVLAKGPAVLLVPALVLGLPSPGRTTRERLRAARLPSVLLAGAAVLALWVIPAWLEAGPAYVRELLVDQATTRIAGQGNKLRPVYYYAVRLIDSGAPWTPLYLMPLALLAWPGGRRRLGPWLYPTLAALLVLLAFTLVPTKHVRYVVGIFPLLGLAASEAVHGWSLVHAAGPAWTRALPHAGRLLAVLGLATLVLGWIVPGGLLPALGPALALIALAALARRPRLDAAPGADGPAVARRRLVGSALVAVALLMSAFWIVRDRYRVREADHFNQQVAAAIQPGVTFATCAALTPADVFTAAPHARWVRSPEALPTAGAQPRLQVLLRADQLAAAQAARGEAGRVLLRTSNKREPGELLLVLFGS